MPEPAVAGSVLSTASALGAGPYLAVAFGLFILAHYLLDQKSKATRDRDQRAHEAARDREHRDQLSEAFAMVTDLNARRVEEMRELMRCTRDGINGSIVEIQKAADRSYAMLAEQQTRCVQGIVLPIQEAFREIGPALKKSTAAIARAEMVMDALAPRGNGHG